MEREVGLSMENNKIEKDKGKKGGFEVNERKISKIIKKTRSHVTSF